jgi:TetR/AcrR family transcriptional regulator, transcriptional repressor for nem operon
VGSTLRPPVTQPNRPAPAGRLDGYTFARIIAWVGRPSFRDKIITSGTRTVHQRGFSTVGLREITAAAGVAQGSFTNHFASKEEFGVAVLDNYFEEVRGVIAETLKDEDRAPRERLQAYFDVITERLAESDWRYGCLAANMALEAAEHSESIRQRLIEMFAEWTPPFAEAIRQAQLAGEVKPDLDPDQAGAALLEAWHGAMLRMKIDRSPAPLDRFKQFILPTVLGAQP